MEQDAETPLTRAQALAAQGRWEQAAGLYRQWLQHVPTDAEAANGLGAALCMLGRAEDALGHFRSALEHASGMGKAAANLGGALQSLGRWEEAADCLQQATARIPDHPQIWFNLGHAQHHLGRFDAAATSYDRAVRLAPAYREAWTNLGVTLRELGRLDESLAALDTALGLDPGHAVTHYNRAFVLLEKGDLKHGWEEHEWRFKAGIATPYPSPEPQWRGEAIAGKTLLIWAEQGFGDTLQFVRFLPRLAPFGARVVLAVQATLVRLLKGIAGAEQVVAWGTPCPHDRHAPLMSLPHVLGLSLDDIAATTTPYVPPPHSVPPRPPGPLRAGLAWAGSPSHKNDRRRSLNLGHAARLAAVPDVEWVSLQIGQTAHPDNLAPPPARIADFHDTAALVQSLDLVVTVDTAAAHLAGAMGIPVWLLLPFAPDWRWLHDRDDSPWYPGMRLFRQPGPGDWDSVMAAVERALADASPAGLRPA